MTIYIFPDAFKEDITWTLRYTGNPTVLPQGTYGGLDCYVIDHPGRYTFQIRDSFGDGICCRAGEGYYMLMLDDHVFIKSDGTYTDTEIWEFSIPCIS